MHIGAGTLFLLLLALGIYRFFPRLAATLVMAVSLNFSQFVEDQNDPNI